MDGVVFAKGTYEVGIGAHHATVHVPRDVTLREVAVAFGPIAERMRDGQEKSDAA